MKQKKLISKALLIVFFVLEFITFQFNNMVYASDLSSKGLFYTENKKIRSILSSQLGFITANAFFSEEDEFEDIIEPVEPSETDSGDETDSDDCSFAVNLFLDKNGLEGPIYKGDKFIISVSIDEFTNINREDISSIEMNLSYDENILNLIKIQGQNGIDNDVIYDMENNKYIILLDSETTDGDIVCEIEFIVLEIPEKLGQTQVEISALGEFNGEFCVSSNNANIDIQIQKREDQIIVNAESGYIIEDDIQDGNIYITRIIPGTTVNSFLSNVLIVTDGDIEFIKTVVNEGELIQITISEDDLISTGTHLKVGEKNITLVVTGDITGSGKITPSDLGGLKLYSIQSQDYILELPNIKACDINNDGKITPTDIAQIKRVLIGDMVINNTIED